MPSVLPAQGAARARTDGGRQAPKGIRDYPRRRGFLQVAVAPAECKGARKALITRG